MKGVRCSWVDMAKIRQALAGNGRGDQERLARMRCVMPGTISKWRHACAVMDVMDGKVSLTTLSSFQPTHAEILGRAYRRRSKQWDDATRKEIVEWVERCEDEGLTVEQLRTALVTPPRNGKSSAHIEPASGCRTVKSLRQLTDAGETFGTIYADPPWKYGNQATRASTNNHYATMTVDEIAALPVAQLAAEGCHLHLWTTNAFLFEGPRIFAAWGFEYKSCFVWVKPQMGIGNYWRVSHEFLLLGVRGKARFLDHGLTSWLQADRGEHSAKPEQVRLMIEKAGPGPRLELFARQKANGWTVWGNEIEPDLFNGKREE